MAKRKAPARKRKPARKAGRAAKRKPAGAARKSRRAAAKSRTARRRAPTRKASGARAAKSNVRAAKPSARAVKPRRPARPSASAARPPASGARPAARRKPAALDRERRRLPEEEIVPTAPSTLGYAQRASSADTGRNHYHQRRREHTEGGPSLTGGELDADWSEAYSSGEEAPGGDMPTPDQDVVEEIGRALGVEYEDAEELKGAEKIEERDRHRWEYDPASSEDYKDRTRKE